jgi:hypothetical protein
MTIKENVVKVGDIVLFNGCTYEVIEINMDAEMFVLDDGAYGFSVYFCDVECLG